MLNKAVSTHTHTLTKYSHTVLTCTLIYKHTHSLCDHYSLSLGVLREGDELLEINGIALMGKSTDEIIRLMVRGSDILLLLLLLLLLVWRSW